MNTKYYGNPSDSCCDISIKTSCLHHGSARGEEITKAFVQESLKSLPNVVPIHLLDLEIFYTKSKNYD